MKVNIEEQIDFDQNVKQESKDSSNSVQQYILDYEQVLEKTGLSRVQWLVFIKTGMTLLMAMNEIIGIGIIAIASTCDFELNTVRKGILTGSSLLGNILSSYFWGYISDTKGRRPVLIASILATNFFTILSTFVPNYWFFVALRFCVGLSISGATNISYAYLGEFFTAYYRPIAINYASLFVAFSVVYVPATAWFILEFDWSFVITKSLTFRPWRLLPFVYTSPGLLSVLMLCLLPESPKILLSLGRVEEAFEAIKWICRTNLRTDILEASNFNKSLSNLPQQGSNKIKRKNIFHKMWHETYPLFQRPLVFNFVICCCAMCSIFMSCIGMGIWFPDIQNRFRENTDPNQSMRVCEAIESSIQKLNRNETFLICKDDISQRTYIDYIIYGGFCIVGYLVLGTIINLFGRKLIYATFLGIAGIFGMALLWIAEPQGILWSFSIFLVLPELCMSITNGIIVDLVPTHLCGQAVCICLLLGRLSSVFATNLIGLLLESHCSATFSIFSVSLMVCATLALLLPISKVKRKNET